MIQASVRWLTAEQATPMLTSGELDPHDVVRAHLDAIDLYDGRIHAYIHVDRDAKSNAGMTLAVKDSLPVKGMPYTYATASRRKTRSPWRGRERPGWRSWGRRTCRSLPPR